ncbi:MAG: MATE family efflux transporter [Methanobacteriaceae archaeon]|jgi:putative MATE family efflux protein|nr:MATE family efflux transporter [Methanobacteriaceae archaeon]
MTQDANERVDLITGDPKKALRKLSWPMMISMFLIMSYNIADTIWVAGLGTDPLAALGFISPLFMIIIGLGNGIGAGATSSIARFIGASDKHKANNAALHSILITLVSSIAIPIIAILILEPVSILMGAEKVLDLTLEYGYIVFIGSFAFLIPSVGAAILRAEGDMRRSTISIAVTAVLNVVIDPIFIYTLNMGVGGAAIASVLSSLISSIVIFYWILIKKDTYLSLKFKEFKYNGEIIKDILLVAMPASVENLVMSILSMVINVMLAIVAGTVSVAIFTAGWRIVNLGMVPVIGIATAAITVGGAAYGARNYDKINITFDYSLKLGILTAIPITLIIYFFAPQIAMIFSYSDASSSLSPLMANLLRVLSLFFIAIPLGMIPASMFQSFGKGMYSLGLTILRELIFTIIFAYLLGFTLGFGEGGIWWGTVIGAFIGGFIAYVFFKIYIMKLKKYFNSND